MTRTHLHPPHWQGRSQHAPAALRRALRILALVGALGIAPIVTAQPIALNAQAPRSFGYSIGDRVERVVELELGAPWSLARASLPTPGRQNAWFDLAEVSTLDTPTPVGRHVTVRFTYQLLNSPTQPTVLLLPRVGLRFEGGPAPVERDVPPAEIFAAPLIPAAAIGSTLDAPRADRKPEPIPVDALRERLSLYGLGAAAVLLMMLAARQFALRRHAGPFVRACRELRRLAHAPTREDPSAAMRIVHRALDETAGHTVFLDNVDTLFASAHRAPLRERTHAFLERSRQLFFAGTGQPPSVTELREFARAWRALEATQR